LQLSLSLFLRLSHFPFSSCSLIPVHAAQLSIIFSLSFSLPCSPFSLFIPIHPFHQSLSLSLSLFIPIHPFYQSLSLSLSSSLFTPPISLRPSLSLSLCLSLSLSLSLSLFLSLSLCLF